MISTRTRLHNRLGIWLAAFDEVHEAVLRHMECLLQTMTQRELAKRMGQSYVHVCNIWNKKAIPTVEFVRKLLEVE